ncbi:MAG: hypothetical protein HQL50_03560 [Magnetococcales bacterium]|nr:hypothetical protein [Magnetococcales bacterium]
MSTGGWGCPHEEDGKCRKVDMRICDPGMKGCVLAGRFVFSNASKNRPGGPKRRPRRDAQGRRIVESDQPNRRTRRGRARHEEES